MAFFPTRTSMSIPIFIPFLFPTCLISPINDSRVGDLVKAVWEEEKLRLTEQEITRPSQLSLRSLVSDLNQNKYSNSRLLSIEFSSSPGTRGYPPPEGIRQRTWCRVGATWSPRSSALWLA